MPVKGLMLFSLLAMASAELAMAAQLETASGLVQARDMREDGGWVTAGSGWALAAGTAVRTGEEGRVVATLPGALLALEGSSNLALVRIEGSTQMILARGVMTLVVEDASGAPPDAVSRSKPAWFAGGSAGPPGRGSSAHGCAASSRPGPRSASW